MEFSLKKIFETTDLSWNFYTLEDFKHHVESSLRKREQLLEADSLSKTEDKFENREDFDEYRMALGDQWFLVSETRKLASELCIVALYKQIEIHTKRVVKRNFPSINGKALSDITKLREALPFTIECLPNFAAFDELRLINNSIKHVGKVSAQLARKFPVWQAGNELKDSTVVIWSSHIEEFISIYDILCLR
jgi:hypothetical protein